MNSLHRLSSCSDPTIDNRTSCTGYFVSDGGLVLQREWESLSCNFDDLAQALGCLYSMSSLEDFIPVIFRTQDVRADQQQLPDYCLKVL